MQRVELAVVDLVGRRAVGALADGDRSRPAGGLQPRGDVDGVADHGVAVADGAGEDLAGVDADAQLEARAMARGQLGVDLAHRGLHPERGAHGALLVVLVRDRRAEDGHDVVADVLVDGAAVAGDLLAEPAQAAVDERLDALGVHPLGHGRVAGEVGEQHGDLAPLVGGRRAARPEAAAGAGCCAAGAARRVERGAARHAELRVRRRGRAARRGSGARAAAPHDMQNFASAGFALPQLLQVCSIARNSSVRERSGRPTVIWVTPCSRITCRARAGLPGPARAPAQASLARASRT